MPDYSGPCLLVLHCDTEEPRSFLIPWEKLPKRTQFEFSKSSTLTSLDFSERHICFLTSLPPSLPPCWNMSEPVTVPVTVRHSEEDEEENQQEEDGPEDSVDDGGGDGDGDWAESSHGK